MKSISFTKLGTVKCDDFEYTYEDFYQKMYDSITMNVEKNRVVYNQNGKYFIVKHNNIDYQVKDDQNILKGNKDLNKHLGELVRFTQWREKQKEEKDKEQQIEEKAKDIAIVNGDKGIFNSEEDKIRYINYLKEKIKNNPASVSKQVFLRILDAVLLGNGVAALAVCITSSVSGGLGALMAVTGIGGASLLFAANKL